jgi:hypothetical protein
MVEFKIPLFLTSLLALSHVSLASRKEKSLDSLQYREYPRRTEEEAAVLEWGHSAIIR